MRQQKYILQYMLKMSGRKEREGERGCVCTGSYSLDHRGPIETFLGTWQIDWQIE